MTTDDGRMSCFRRSSFALRHNLELPDGLGYNHCRVIGRREDSCCALLIIQRGHAGQDFAF